MSTLGDFLIKKTKNIRKSKIRNFLMNDFFAGIDAGKAGIKIPFFMNIEYRMEVERIIKESEIKGKFWELYERSMRGEIWV